jgi:CAAX protease family protein
MSNTSQGRFLNLSRLLIAFGVFVLTAFLFVQIGDRLVNWLFGVNSKALIQKAVDDFNQNELIAIKVFQTISASSFLLAAYIIMKVYRKPLGGFMRLTNRPHYLHIVLGLAVFLSMIPLMSALIEFNSNLVLPEGVANNFKAMEHKSDNLYQVFLKLNQGPYFVSNILMMAVLPALGEELIFRGIFMRIFVSWTKNIHIGIILSAVLFAVLHFQPYKILPMFLIAVLLGYLYYLTGSLWVPILVHFINNAIVVLADLLIKKGYNHELLNPEYVYPFNITIISTIVLALLIFVLIKKTKPAPFEQF